MDTIVNSKNETFRTPTILDDAQMKSIKAYIKRKVKSYIRTHKEFDVKDLFGYDNWDWNGTPLNQIYVNYFNQRNDETYSYSQSGKTLGWILKNVIHEMEEKFVLKHSEHQPVRYHLKK